MLKPPKVVIEVDTKADLKGYGKLTHYVLEKTDDLIKAGVNKVIWVFTKEKRFCLLKEITIG